ncbi:MULTISPECIES: GAF domain-containing protein [unclassified Nostoc]|uniref:sensor histidine kinase n=1 Tax=unclassified Nostoc TaxID=2593658 RepID=UPI002AD1F95E|nr:MULTISPECIES: GAF domain-containing protein [unclassified Nostoc]MDZ8121218.1 GAF domain-containing protein [Nostoc sp. CmiVER01]MDZ8224160.1 GAF domain-containing protein [Nostoc sp. ChiVER01]
MNINPMESTMELTKLSPPQILFGTEVDEKSSSEQFLLSMYDSVQASIFVVDVLEDGDFRYVALNPTHEQWIGIRSDDLRGKKPEDILSPNDAAKVRQHYAECVLFGKTISYEQCLQFQGVQTWWSTTLTPLRDANSRIYRLIGTSSNITPVKQAEQAVGLQVEREQLLEAIAGRIHQSVELETILHQTTIQLRQFLNCDRVLIYRFETDGSGVIIAESTVTDPLLGKNITDPCFSGKYPEHYRQDCIQIVEDIYADGLHPCHIDFLASLQVRANLTVPIFKEQDMWGLLIAQHCHQSRQWQQTETDLTLQLATQIGIAARQAELRQQIKDLQAKLELQKQKQKNQLQQVRNFQALVRRMTEQIRDSLDESQVLQTVTQELAELLNLDRCQIELYSTCQTLVTITYEYSINLPRCQGLTRQIADRLEVYQSLLQKQPLQFLEIVPGWQPKLLVMSQMACPVFDTQGILGNIWLTRPTQEAFDEFEIELVQQVANECAIAIRQAQLYQQTQAQVKELENCDRLKNQFLRNLSQELRTPITSISLAVQTLESVLTPAEILEIEIVPQLLQILHNECARENKLINDLLTLTYLEAEPDPPTLIAIDLQSWLHPIVESFRDLTTCQRQQLNLSVDPALPLLETDITDMERIITELLNHVCKYTPAGESVTVSAHLAEDAVELNISNSGLELTSNELSRIFEPFYHPSKHDPWKHSGTGLELALVQKMIRHLGGSIYVESGAGQTTFSIRFPL